METLQTLERGLLALEVIAQHHAQLTVAQLAEQLKINRTIAYRVTNTLSVMGYIKTNENQCLELTSKISALNCYFEKTIPFATQQVLNQLAKDTQSSASLVMADGTDCVVVKTAATHSNHIQINYQLGSRLAIGHAASGLAIAATFPEQLNDSIELKQVRELGYASTTGIFQKDAIGMFMPLPGRHLAIGIVHLGEVDQQEILKKLADAVRMLS